MLLELASLLLSWEEMGFNFLVMLKDAEVYGGDGEGKPSLPGHWRSIQQARAPLGCVPWVSVVWQVQLLLPGWPKGLCSA